MKLHQAKAQRILRRDLAVCQQERIQREEEEEAAAARQNKAREEAIPRADTTTNATNESKQKIGETPLVGNPSKQVKSDATTESKGGVSEMESEKAVSGPETTGLSLPTTKPIDTSNQKSTQPAVDSSKDDTQQAKSADPFPEPTPTSAGLKDFDFDSMFPDSTGDNNDINPESNANNDFDFSLELPENNMLSNDAGQASMDSLLPGLESYANGLGDTAGTGDLNSSDLPNTGSQTDAAQDGVNMGGDSTFDDLFSYADFEMGQGTGQGDNNGMAETDFDDLFLNPE